MKKVNMTLCKSVCTKVFTVWPSMSWKHAEIPETKLKTSGGKTTKSGGSDPTFPASGRPKSFWGRSRLRAPWPVPVVFPPLQNESR